MKFPAGFRETRASIPAIEAGRFERLADSRYDEALALVPEVHVMEIRNERDPPLEEELRVVVWNGERGRFALERAPPPPADVYLLNEMDVGMARTGNDHTVRVLADRLELNYLFGVEFLELTKGEPEERQAAGENALGFHGNAILSRWKLREPRLVRLSGGAQWLDDDQKRVGSRMALVCLVDTATGPVRFVCTHLESESPPSLRGIQMRELSSCLESDDRDIPTVLGGDLNTWSFDKRDARERASLARDPETASRLLRPMEWEPLCAELTSHGYELERSNEIDRGTYPVPGFDVEARLDWIATKGLGTREPSVIPAPYSERLGRPISDHHAVALSVHRP